MIVDNPGRLLNLI